MTDCLFTPIYDDSCSFTEDLRFLDTTHTTQERELYSSYFEEQIDQFGTSVDYIQNEYTLSSHDPMYGEHTTKNFADPVPLVMYVVFNDDSIILNQYGIESQGDITAFIPISSFYTAFGVNEEPKSGDLIKLTEYGQTNRPNGRESQIFEITHRDDEDVAQTVPLMGHYIWKIWAKRYDYSYETNVDPEKVINQINDDVVQSEGLSGTASLSSVADNVDKTYTSSADELASIIFDYDDNTKSNDSVYGDY
jgi:hypothetical protein